MAGLPDPWREIAEFVVHDEKMEWFCICRDFRNNLANLAQTETEVRMLQIFSPGGEYQKFLKEASYFGAVRARHCNGNMSSDRRNFAFLQAVFTLLKHNGYADDIAGPMLRLEQAKADDVVEAALGLGWIRRNRAESIRPDEAESDWALEGDFSIGDPLANMNLAAEFDVEIQAFREELEMALRSMERVVAFLQAEERSDLDIINFLRGPLSRVAIP
jgi:hypothetical protein